MRISFEHVGVDDDVLARDLAALMPYQATLHEASGDHTYATPEAALACGTDEAAIQRAVALRERFGSTLKTVLLVGIGGSDLGTRALYDALRGHAAQYTTSPQTPRLVAFGTVEPQVLRHARALIEAHLDPEELVLVVVSKSGNTTETLANARVLYSCMEEVYGAAVAARQTIVISDPDTPLAEHASTHGMTHVPMPRAVGGRYSVGTAVGLVPLALLGVNVVQFAAGYAAGAAASVPARGSSSAAVLASVLAHGYAAGRTMHEMFLWHPELETLGKWYRQLLAESIGKHDASGVPIGITPTVAVGSVDLHSHGQLVFGGPDVRTTTFVAAPSAWDGGGAVPASDVFTLPAIDGTQTGEVIHAIYEGVRSTYHTHNLPCVDLTLAALDERELGAFMALKMASVMYLAKLLGVQAFDQPDVESYKAETRRILESQ